MVRAPGGEEGWDVLRRKTATRIPARASSRRAPRIIRAMGQPNNKLEPTPAAQTGDRVCKKEGCNGFIIHSFSMGYQTDSRFAVLYGLSLVYAVYG